MTSSDTVLRATISDDGCGFEPATATSGYGLAGMRARVSKVGGTIRIRSAPGAGTDVAHRVAHAEAPGKGPESIRRMVTREFPT
ncbi:ATP-binding protein [Streptomyces sp. NPDC085932]|uniref:ATP-binding protein n=1 Tax=Streptomyces sp. NPDC085932 TaxID=3365741 RepID=UPI0037CD3542